MSNYKHYMERINFSQLANMAKTGAAKGKEFWSKHGDTIKEVGKAGLDKYQQMQAQKSGTQSATQPATKKPTGPMQKTGQVNTQGLQQLEKVVQMLKSNPKMMDILGKFLG